jgi:hypothetical protein
MKMKLNFVSLLALVAMPVAHAGVFTCDEQEPCVDWTMDLPDVHSCELGDAGVCIVEVCMIVDNSLDGCNTSGTFSHMCDQTGSDGCTLWDGTDPVMSGNGDTSDCTADGEGNSTQLSGKCSGFEYVKMCQEGVPGQILHWILKDGSASIPDIETQDYWFNTTECNAEVSCGNNLEQCGGGTNQQLMERTWMFKIPDTCNICDDPPGGDPGGGPGGQGDPHCK